MNQILHKIIDDLRSGQNLDAYLTVFVCLGVLILDIFGITQPSIISAGILASLLLITIGVLTTRRSNEKIEKTLSKLSESQPFSGHFFREWDNNHIRHRIASANEIYTLALANYNFFNLNSEEIRTFLARGGKLRCAMMKPNGNAVKMAEMSGYGVETTPDHLNRQIILALEAIRPLTELTLCPNNIEVKIIDHFPMAVLTIINPYEADGIMFVTVYGFGKPFTSRPSFVLQRDHDHKWYSFYLESYEKIWASSACESINVHEDGWFKKNLLTYWQVGALPVISNIQRIPEPS